MFAKGKEKCRGGGQDLKDEHPFFGAPIPQAQAGADGDFGDDERGCVFVLSRGPLPRSASATGGGSLLI